MGEAGDLLLIFADALVRSWKQITKFKSSGAASPAAQDPAQRSAPAPQAPAVAAPSPGEAAADFNLEGLIKDERGIRMAPEGED
jgi:cyanophycin synthetase